MTKGKVTYFNDHRGWGIISQSGEQQDVYVHYTAIKQEGFKTLVEGQEVSFELNPQALRPEASAVYPID
jgi:CspA family cold shock protein